MNICCWCLQRGAEVHLVPWNYDYSRDDFDGLFISNGPGDPALALDAISNLRKVSAEYKYHLYGVFINLQLKSHIKVMPPNYK